MQGVNDKIKLQGTGLDYGKFRKQNNEEKIVFQVAAHMITDKIFNTEQVFDCQCQYDFHLGAKNVCRVVSVKEKEPVHVSTYIQ